MPRTTRFGLIILLIKLLVGEKAVKRPRKTSNCPSNDIYNQDISQLGLGRVAIKITLDQGGPIKLVDKIFENWNIH